MASTHLSEGHLTQLSCKEECGSIPNPELYRYFPVPMASSQQQLIGAPGWCAPCFRIAQRTMRFRIISAQRLPLPANPGQSVGRDLHCLCYTLEKRLQSFWCYLYQNAKENMLPFFLASLCTCLSCPLWCSPCKPPYFSPPFHPYCWDNLPF